MAKTRKGKTGKATGAERPGKRIPKTVAGVKLPKDVRRAGDAILARAASPEGKAMIAGGLSMAVAGIAAMAERNRKPAGPAPAASRTEESPVDTAADPRHGQATAGVRDPQAIADVVGNAVEAAFARILKKL